jgi:DNA-binding transcriptional LysR family regulator
LNAAVAQPDVLRDETKASSVVQSRVWRAFDQFVESSGPRWSGRAGAILNSEGNRAAKAYAELGAGAAVAAVDDTEWRYYIRSLWLTVVPDAGELIMPYLPVAKISTVLAIKAVMSPLVQAAVEWIRANGAREAALIANVSRKNLANQIMPGKLGADLCGGVGKLPRLAK